MRISVTNEAGDIGTLDVSPDFTIAELKPLLLAKFKSPIADVLFNGSPLTTGTLKSNNILHDDILLVKLIPPQQVQQSGAGGSESEVVRHQILANEALRQQVISVNYA